MTPSLNELRGCLEVAHALFAGGSGPGSLAPRTRTPLEESPVERQTEDTHYRQQVIQSKV